MYGHYKKITNEMTGVFTSKDLTTGGSLGRKQATGYGLLYIVEEMFRTVKSEKLAGKTAVISGSGNVAVYAAEKAQQLGMKVLTMSDSAGYILDEDGVDLELVKQIKEIERARISEYAKRKPGAKYFENSADIWSVKCDVALPCATQNELDGESAGLLVKNGVTAVAEGANMPSTPEATEIFTKNKILFIPGKAANAGGVATSGLEMAQNSGRVQWTFEEVDAKLKQIMINIFKNIHETAKKYGAENNYVTGSNIAGFIKVATSMLWQGVAH
jgi:glutamate dehydrogenase (NADP+)